MQSRRTLFAVAIGLAAAGLLAGCSKPTPVADADDLFIGKADAPITLVEYASVACPICAQWQNQVLPDFKKKYIDTGQVKLVTREMNAHNPAFSTAGFLVARCAGKERYHQVVDAIYRDQTAIEASGQYQEGLQKIAREAGLSKDQFETCVTDPVAIDAQIKRVDRFARQDNVTSTPTFVIDGQVVAEGFIGMTDLDAIIATAKNKQKAG